MGQTPSTTYQANTQNFSNTCDLKFHVLLQTPYNISVLDAPVQNPVTWSTSEVISWLRECNLEEYSSVFLGNLHPQTSFI